MKRWTELVFFLLASFRIDNDQIRVRIFILQRPQKFRVGVHFQAVVMAGHDVGVHDSTVHLIFDHLGAFAVGAVGQIAVAITDEDMVVEHRDGIGRAQSRGRLREHSQLIWRDRVGCRRSLSERQSGAEDKRQD